MSIRYPKRWMQYRTKWMLTTTL